MQGGGVRFFQMHMPHDNELTLNLLNQAQVFAAPPPPVSLFN